MKPFRISASTLCALGASGHSTVRSYLLSICNKNVTLKVAPVEGTKLASRLLAFAASAGGPTERGCRDREGIFGGRPAVAPGRATKAVQRNLPVSEGN